MSEGRKVNVRTLSCLISALLLTATAAVSADPAIKDGYFTTSDGVRLHYLEAGHVLFVDETERFNAILEEFAQACFALR